MNEQKSSMHQNITMISVLGSPGYLTKSQSEKCSELIRLSGNNTGNLVFQHAANILFDVEKKNLCDWNRLR